MKTWKKLFSNNNRSACIPQNKKFSEQAKIIGKFMH